MSEAAADEPAARPGLLALLRGRDHTRGNLMVSVLALAVPSVLTMTFSFGLFQVFELSFLGRLGEAALAAAGSSDQVLRQGLMLLVMGMALSSQMMISRLVGAGSVEGAEHAAGQTFVLGGALALLAAALGVLAPEMLVRLIARDPEVIALATIYVRIVFVSFFLLVAGQLFAAILQGAGDSTTPMLTSFVTTPVSIVAQWALTFGRLGAPELGIAGIPLGAAFGSAWGAAISMFMLFSGRCRVHLHAHHLVPDAALLRRLLALSWQPALHMLARSLIVMFFMVLAGQLGGKVQAAYTIGLRLEMLVILLAFPIANACATLVGQNLGAGNLARAWGAIRTSALVEIAVLWPLAAAVFWFRHELVAQFAHDPEVARLAAEYLAYSSVVFSFYGLYFVAFRTLQAAGDMRSPMLISVGSAVFVGAPLGWWLATQSGLGATGMWIANLIYALLNAGLMIAWLLYGAWAERYAR